MNISWKSKETKINVRSRKQVCDRVTTSFCSINYFFLKVEQMALYCFSEPSCINLTYLNAKSVHRTLSKVTNLTEVVLPRAHNIVDGYYKFLLLTMFTPLPFSHLAPSVAHQHATQVSTKPTQET